MSYLELGKKIKNERKRLHLTQSELCGDYLTRNMLSRIETGSANPSLETLEYIASRLGVSAGYLISDEDSEDDLKYRRLLSMIKSEYENGNYSLCLDYLEAIPEKNSEAESLYVLAKHSLAIELLYLGQLKKALSLFEEVALMKTSLSWVSRESHLYRTYIKRFLSDPDQSGEGGIISSLCAISSSSSDLIPMFRVIELLDRSGTEAAQTLLSVTSFSNSSYRCFAEAHIAMKNGDYESARIKTNECMGYTLDPIMKTMCYSVLEKSSAELKDYEKAYAYSQRRKEAVSKLTSD